MSRGGLPRGNEDHLVRRGRLGPRRIWSYIARDSPHYARRLVGRLIDAVEPLAELPEMGRRVPESASRELRELIVERYRIIYRIAGDQLQILTVIHGSRDVAQLLDR